MGVQFCITDIYIFTNCRGQGELVSCTGVAVIPRGDIGGPQAVLVTLQGCKMCNAVLFTQDHLCMVNSHIPCKVILLHRTQQI